MTYRCACCRTVFTEPLVLTRKENLDGERGVETQRWVLCPWCGEEQIETIETEEDANGTI